jgi:fibronectin-binding autotransporter adhesin
MFDYLSQFSKKKVFRIVGRRFLEGLLIALSPIASAATIMVTSNDASLLSTNGQVSLAEAIQAANDDISVDGSAAGSGSDIIVFHSSLSGQTIRWSSATALSVTSNITIDGDINGDGVADVILSGDVDNDGVRDAPNSDASGFNITSNNLTLRNLDVRHFSGNTGATGFVRTNGGSAVIENSTFRDNAGTIINSSTTAGSNLTIRNSLFYDNNASVAGATALGSLIRFIGPTTGSATHLMENVVVVNNTGNNGTIGSVAGGAVFISGASANVSIINSTIANNSLTNSNTGAIGGAIGWVTAGTVTIQNTVITGNTVDGVSDKNISVGTTTTYTSTTNLIDTTVDFVNPDNPDNRDYRLASTAANAINQGTAAGAPATDIRGFERPRGGGVDIGAYEVLYASAPVVDLDTTAAGNDSSVEFSGSAVTIMPNIDISQSDGDTQVSGATLSLTGILDAGDETLSLTAGQISTAASYGIVVSGSGTTSMTLSGVATLANYETILALVQYNNVNGDYTDGVRSVTVSVNDDMGSTNRTASVVVLPTNTNPIINNLNGDTVSWAGVGGWRTLDAGDNTTVSDAELDIATWNNATLTVQRVVSDVNTPLAADLFQFNQSGFTVSGANLQDGATTFGAFTNANGVLSISFNANADATLVQSVMRGIQYRNDVPTGDTVIRFTLSDGDGGSANANVTVTSDTIYVTSATDTTVMDVSDGVNFREAVAIAAADLTGNQTIVFSSSLAGLTLGINAPTININESLTFDMDATSGITLSGDPIALGMGTTQTFINGAGDTATITNAIQGPGTITKTGAGNLTLSGNNSFSGATTISAGTLTVSGAGTISTNSNVSVAAGATLALTSNATIGNLSGAGDIDLGSSVLTTIQTDNTTFFGNISGTGGLTITQPINAGYSLTLSGTNSYSGNTTTTNYGWVRLDGDASVSANSALLIQDSSKVTLLSDQTVGSLTMTTTSATLDLGVGGYTLTAGGNNTSTDVLGVISGSGNLWKQGAGTMTVTGINNTYNGNTVVTGGTLSIASDAGLGSGAVILASPDATLAIIGNTTIDNAIAITDTATISVSADATISGIIGGDNLIKAGTAKLTLSGNNTYTGTTSVSAGILSIGASTALGDGNILLAAGTTLEVTGVTDITNGIVLSGNATISNSANATVSGNISGLYHLTKSGGSTLTLSGENSYTDTTVSAGTLSIASDSNLGGGTVSLAGATALSITGDDATIDNAITLTGNATINAAANATISGSIGGNFDLTKAGIYTLTLTGTNTYTGSTHINGGALSIVDDTNLGVGVINLGMASSTLAVTGSGTIDNNMALTGSATLQVASDLTWSGAISGNNILNKKGAGVLTLSATNTATGALTVSEGTLLVTGSIVNATNVAGGATLGGTGTVGNIVTVQNGGTLAPGVSGVNGGIGKLTINGGLDMQSGSTLAVQINGTDAGDDYDQMVVSGGVNVSDAILAPTHSYVSDNGDEYTIIDNDGVDDISGIFAGLAQSDTITAGGNGSKLTANYTGGDGNDFTLIGPINNAPVVNNLGGSIAYTAGTTVLLDNSGDAEVTDVEDDVDNWNGGSLVVQRTFGGVADPTANDSFGFDVGMAIEVDGNSLKFSGLTFATFTNEDGVLTINFTGTDTDVTTDFVEQLIRNITYGNDTPYGNATIRFALIDSGGRTTNTDVMLISSVIYVTKVDDDMDGDASDGFSLREALDRSLAQASADSIYVVLPDNATVTFGAGVTSGAGDALNLSGANGLTITGSALILDGALTINTGAADVTLGSNLVGTASLTKVGTGTLTLTNTNNEASFSGAIAINGGILAVGDDNALSSGALQFDGGTLRVSTGGTVIDNAMSFGNGGGTLHADVDWTASGVFSGSGQVNKTGLSGILTLSGISLHTGVTSIAEGMLAVGGDENLGTGILELNGGTFSVNAPGKTIDNNINVTSDSGFIQIDLGLETTLSGLISGTGEILKNGGGKLNLTNSGNSATSWSFGQVNGTTAIASADMIGSGNLRLAGGTLEINNSGNTVFNQDVAVTSSSAIVAQGNNISSTVSFSGAMTGNGNLSISVIDTNVLLYQASALTGDLTLTSTLGAMVIAMDNSNFGLGTITLTNGTTLGVAGAPRTITNDIVLAGNATIHTVAPAAPDSVITFSGNISDVGGSRNLAVNAGGLVVQLAGNNTYTGATELNNGTLRVASDNNLGSGQVVFSGGTLNITGTTIIDNTVGFSAMGTIQVDAVATLTGVISGAGQMTKTGEGTLILTGTQSHSGGMAINQGTLSLASDANLTSGNIVFNGGTLAVTGATTIDNNIAFNASLSGTIEANAAATLSGVLSGSGSFIKTGSAVLTLTGTQTHSGTTQISAGTLSVASDANLGSGAITLENNCVLSITGVTNIDNNITLVAEGVIQTSAAATLSGVISGSGDLRKSGASSLTLSATQAYTGTTTVSSGTLAIASDANLGAGVVFLDGGTLLVTGVTTIDKDLHINSTSTLETSAAVTWTGTVSGGAVSLNKSGSETLILTNSANRASFEGNINVQQGTLAVANGDALSDGDIFLAHETTLRVGGVNSVVSNNILVDGYVDLVTDAAVSSNGVTFTGDITENSPGLRVTISADPTNHVIFSNNLMDVFITSLKAGTLILADAEFNQNLVIDSDTRLEGSGGIFNLQVFGVLAPGTDASPGFIETYNDLTFLLGSHLEIDIGGPLAGQDYDQISAAGTMSLSGAEFVLNSGAYIPEAGDNFIVIAFTGGTYPGFQSLQEGSKLTQNGEELRISYIAGDGNDFALLANSYPTITGDPETSVDQDQPYSFTPTASDVDLGDTLTFSIENKPDWASFDTDTGALTGTPTNDDVGTTTGIVISVSDGTLTASLPAFDLEVVNVNDAPEISGTPATNVDQGQLYSFTPTASDVDAGDTLEFSIVNKPVWANFNTATGELSGTPGNEHVGTTNGIVITVSDGTDSVSLSSFNLTVVNVNDAPIINSTPILTATQDTAYSYILTISDIDAGDTLTLSGQTVPAWLTFSAATGVLIGTPTNAHVGSHDVVLRVTDAGGLFADQSFTIVVTNVNDAPIISSTPITAATQDTAYSYTFAASDIDAGDTLTLSGQTVPAWLTFNAATGVLSGTPTNADVGSHNVVLRVTDTGGLFADQSFTIVVADVNDAPVISGTPATSVHQDQLYSFTPTASDVDANDTLSFSATGLPTWLTINPATGAISGTPSNADVGTTGSIVITVSDGSLSASLPAFSITVVNVNDAPVIVADQYSVNEGGVLTLNAVDGVLANDSDNDVGDTLTAILVSGPQYASQFTLNADGSFQYVHDGSETLADSFTYAINDGTVTSDPATVSLTINPVNDAPEFVTDPVEVVQEGESYLYNVGVVDPDSVIELSLLEGPEWLSLVGHQLVGVAPLDEPGPVEVVLRADDGEYTADQIYNLTVLERDATYVTITTAWEGLPSIVGHTADLFVTVTHHKGPQVTDGRLVVTLQDLDVAQVMAGCVLRTGSFVCPVNLVEGASVQFRLRVTPQEEGNLIVNLNVEQGNDVLSRAITDVSVAERSVSQGNVSFNLAKATALASIDLLEDDVRELVAGTSLGDTVKLLDYNPLDGQVTVIGEIANRGYNNRILVRDIDNDGLEDILVVNRHGVDPTTVYYDRGGEFLPESGSVTLAFARDAVLRDLNGDTYPELILGAGGLQLYIYENNNGVYDKEPLVFTSLVSILHFALLSRMPTDGDFEGTLAIATPDHVQLVRFDQQLGTLVTKPGAETDADVNSQKFTLLQQLPLSGVSSLRVADLDGDGREEIIVSTTHQNSSSDASGITIISVQDDDSLEIVERLGAASAHGVDIADFNGDKIPDLLVANDNNTYQFYRGTGEVSGFTLTNTVLYHESSLVLTAYLNDDFLADVVIYDADKEQVEVYLSDPDGDPGEIADLSLSANVRAVRTDVYHFEYTLNLANRGEHIAENVKVLVSLPAGVGVVNLPDNCTHDEEVEEVNCTLPSLEPDEEQPIVLVLSGDSRINTLSLTAYATSDALEENASNNSVTTSLAGMFQPKRARIKGGGGCLDYLWLAGLLGLELARRRRKARAIFPAEKTGGAGLKAASLLLPLAAVLALSQSPQTQAQNSYLEGTFASVTSDWDALHFYYDMAGSTQAGMLREKDDQRFGWQLLYGFRAHRNFAIELGYLDSGETELEVDAVVSDTEPLRQLLIDNAPISGEGPYLGLRASYFGESDQELYLKAGLWSWSAGYTLTLDDQREWVTRDGTDWLFGFGFSVPVNDRLNVGGSAQSTSLGGERLVMIGLNVSFQFDVGR